MRLLAYLFVLALFCFTLSCGDSEQEKARLAERQRIRDDSIKTAVRDSINREYARLKAERYRAERANEAAANNSPSSSASGREDLTPIAQKADQLNRDMREQQRRMREMEERNKQLKNNQLKFNNFGKR